MANAAEEEAEMACLKHPDEERSISGIAPRAESTRTLTKTGLLGALRPSLVAIVAVPAVLGLVVWGEVAIWNWGHAPRRSGPRQGHVLPVAASPARALLESPELVELVVEQVYEVNASANREHLHHGVAHVLSQFGSLLDHHLSPRDKLAIRDANIDSDTWRDLGKVLRAVRNGTVVDFGRHILKVVANTSSTEEDIRSLLRNDIRAQGEQLLRLRAELVPARFVAARGADHDRELFQAVLSPEAMQEMRRTDAPRAEPVQQSAIEPQQISSHVVALKQRFRHLLATGGAPATAAATPMLRRLDENAEAPASADTWSSPKLNTAEFVSSLVGVTMVFVLELIIHLSYWIGFSMPLWAWLMLLCPTEGMAVMTCLFGHSIWCSVILGTLGFNVIEAEWQIGVAIDKGGTTADHGQPMKHHLKGAGHTDSSNPFSPMNWFR